MVVGPMGPMGLMVAVMALAAGAAADDTAALRAFKASGDDPYGALRTWTEGTAPCGEGWGSSGSGWVGVRCDARGGRVTYLGRWGSSGLTGSVAELAPLTQLRTLDLSSTGVTGSVAELAPLTQLTILYLSSTGVTGSVAGLAPLTQLTYLSLYSTGVHGDATCLRERVPGLSGWGSRYNDYGSTGVTVGDGSSCDESEEPGATDDEDEGIPVTAPESESQHSTPASQAAGYEDEGLPESAVVAIAVLVVLLAVGVAVAVAKKRRRPKLNPAAQINRPAPETVAMVPPEDVPPARPAAARQHPQEQTRCQEQQRHDALVTQFQATCSVDAEKARSRLRAAGWDLPAAIDSHLAEEERLRQQRRTAEQRGGDVAEFMRQRYTDEATAREQLQRAGWDLPRALASYMPPVPDSAVAGHSRKQRNSVQLPHSKPAREDQQQKQLGAATQAMELAHPTSAGSRTEELGPELGPEPEPEQTLETDAESALVVAMAQEEQMRDEYRARVSSLETELESLQAAHSRVSSLHAEAVAEIAHLREAHAADHEGGVVGHGPQSASSLTHRSILTHHDDELAVQLDDSRLAEQSDGAAIANTTRLDATVGRDDDCDATSRGVQSDANSPPSRHPPGSSTPRSQQQQPHFTVVARAILHF